MNVHQNPIKLEGWEKIGVCFTFSDYLCNFFSDWHNTFYICTIPVFLFVHVADQSLTKPIICSYPIHINVCKYYSYASDIVAGSQDYRDVIMAFVNFVYKYISYAVGGIFGSISAKSTYRIKILCLL